MPGILTGICSVIGNSFAIVPARSHEFVMVTSALKSSPHKNPQLVPSYYKTVKYQKKLVQAEYEEEHFLRVEVVFFYLFNNVFPTAIHRCLMKILLFSQQLSVLFVAFLVCGCGV